MTSRIDSAALSALGLLPTRADLDAVRAAIRTACADGLAREGGALAMLPAFLPPPSGAVAGDALAFDAGGTKLRAAWVRFDAAAGPRVLAQLEGPLPGAAGRPAADAGTFFDAHATLARDLGAPAGLPIGYCFSYPARVLPDGDAELVRWTKEVRVDGVEGRAVGRLLREALLRAGLDAGPVGVVNDTIAVLLAGAAQSGGARAESTLGLIVGTGFNMGAFVDGAGIGKLAADLRPAGPTAVNFEAGGFALAPLGPVDEAVDSESDAPGRQRLEKAVSGVYLGRVLVHAARLAGVDVPGDVHDAGDVVALVADGAGTDAGALGSAVLARSADLVATALAAASDIIPACVRVRVAAEGGLVERGAGYAARVRERLVELTSRDVELGGGGGSTVVGAAIAARIRAR